MNKNTEQTSRNILAAKYVNIVMNIWYVEPYF